jgi:ferric-dicitrate binding protein FerR (iron transport regulator)
LPSWIKYSSAIAAILIVAFIIWNPFNPGSVVVVAKNGHQRIELPDHSIIMLRKGSRLSYRKAFSEGERKVSLEGEAFFDVARDEKHPFIIDAQAVSVKVLGTSFNVFCTEYAASVTVATGRVAVASRKHPQKSVILSPGNTANYEDGRLSSIEATGDEMFWMDGKLSFDNDPFEEAIMAIASAKRTAVAIDADLPQTQRIQPVNASFQNQSVEDMLTELCLITNTRWERQGEAYIVRAK